MISKRMMPGCRGMAEGGKVKPKPAPPTMPPPPAKP